MTPLHYLLIGYAILFVGAWYFTGVSIIAIKKRLTDLEEAFGDLADKAL